MKKVNKSQQIRDLIDKGVSNNEIVKKLKVSQQLVYIVSRAYRGKNSPRKAVKRVGAVKKSNVSDLIAALKTIIKALERA
jgi:DNA invertase Pin-like site-specific DNA recombinase